MREQDSFWAAIFISIAATVAIVALFSHSKDSSAVITMASSIITGAFGYVQGKKSTRDTNPSGIDPNQNQYQNQTETTKDQA